VSFVFTTRTNKKVISFCKTFCRVHYFWCHSCINEIPAVFCKQFQQSFGDLLILPFVLHMLVSKLSGFSNLKFVAAVVLWHRFKENYKNVSCGVVCSLNKLNSRKTLCQKRQHPMLHSTTFQDNTAECLKV